MIVTEETKANAQAVLDYLLANPEKHHQSNWVGEDGRYFWREHSHVTEQNFCGTTLCAAGATIYLLEGIQGLNAIGNAADGSTWSAAARGYLGFEDDRESDQLFYEMDNDLALDMLTAIAQGDVEKFNYLAGINPETDTDED